MEKDIIEKKDGNTPADMIRMAVSGGADLEQLEKLLNLQEKWEANEARKAYHKAMAAFKANPPEIDKDKTVSFGNTKYNHASLANVVKKITVELSKHGLSASWNTKQNGHITVTCRITHVMGHCEETALSADSDTSGSKNSIQALGSTISYLERYTILAALGLATKEQDDDAQGVVEKINDKQLGELRDLLIVLGDENREGEFAKLLKVDSLENLPSKDFNKALQALITKKENRAKKEGKK